MLKEIRIHGRGGQGNVTASEFLAEAAFNDGRYAQSFPMFGSERHGAPVVAFVRISDEPIRRRSQIYDPDYVIVQDVSLFRDTDVMAGLKDGGLVVINLAEGSRRPPVPEKYRLVAVPATSIALEMLKRPIINTVMVGAFAGASGELSLESLESSVLKRYPGELGEKEVEAMRRAFLLAGGEAS